MNLPSIQRILSERGRLRHLGMPGVGCDFGSCGGNGFGPGGAVALGAGEVLGGAACFGTGVCEAALTAVAIAAGAAAVGYAGYRLYSNITENSKFDYAVSEVERRCGRKLTKDQRQRLHREISRRGFQPEEIIEVGVAMYCPGR